MNVSNPCPTLTLHSHVYMDVRRDHVMNRPPEL